jgi:hypothetical protein
VNTWRRADLDHAPFTIDEFKLGETQKEADMIETFARGLTAFPDHVKSCDRQGAVQTE